jgi:hypothetical protein
MKGEIFASILFALFGLFLINGTLRSINNSASPIIDRKEINSIKFIKGIPGLTRSRFEIRFNAEGKTKKRLILLPGSIAGKQAEINNAVQIMKEENLIN